MLSQEMIEDIRDAAREYGGKVSGSGPDDFDCEFTLNALMKQNLQGKRDEYKERIQDALAGAAFNMPAHPTAEMLNYLKHFAADRVLSTGKVSFRELLQEIRRSVGPDHEIDNDALYCAAQALVVIGTYNANKGQDLTGGTGVPSQNN